MLKEPSKMPHDWWGSQLSCFPKVGGQVLLRNLLWDFEKQILSREQYVGVWRCGISLGVLNLISHEWGQLNTWREFPYLQATMNYVLYYILNTLLTRSCLRSYSISERYALLFIQYLEWVMSQSLIGNLKHVKLSLFCSSGDTLFLSLVGIPLKHNIIILLTGNNNLVIHYSLFYSLFVTLPEMMFHSICPMLENAAEHLPISWEQCRTELWLLLGRRRTKV